jgi:hypothetical protein
MLLSSHLFSLALGSLDLQVLQWLCEWEPYVSSLLSLLCGILFLFYWCWDGTQGLTCTKHLLFHRATPPILKMVNVEPVKLKPFSAVF